MSEATPPTVEGPDMPLPPALYPLCVVGSAYMVDKYLPLALPDFLTARPNLNSALAAGILLLGLGLMSWAVLSLRSHNTTALPHKASTTLVTTGPFRWSRNPVYLGFTLLLIAMFFSSLNLWLLFFTPINILLLQHYVISPEEKYLKKHFSSDYADYQAKVRRWL